MCTSELRRADLFQAARNNNEEADYRTEKKAVTLIANEKNVESVITATDMLEVIDLIEDAYRQKREGVATLYPRQTIQYPPDKGYYADSAIRLLAGFLPRMDSAAVRLYPLSHPDEITEDGHRILDYKMGQEILLYYRYDNQMELAGIFSGRRIMDLRTAAPTGVATRHLSRNSSRVLGIVGAGRHAPWQIQAICAVRPIEEVKIYSPTEVNREKLAYAMRGQIQARVSAVDSARKAVDGADIVTTVTNANEPVIAADWLADGTHVNVVARGEIDDATLIRSGSVWCSWREQILRDVPEFRPVPDVLRSGRLSENDFYDLDEAITGSITRQRESDVTVFLSQGVGMWDAAVAAWAYRRLLAHGVGLDLEL